MRKEKIAFVVEEDFYSRHFGVRNFFTTIKRRLEEKYLVDYVICTFCHGGTLWYRVVANDEGANLATKKIALSKNEARDFNFATLQNFLNGDEKAINTKYAFQYLGQSLECENYDICIITNPWLLEAHTKISAKKIFGIAHDFVANVYSLTNKTGDFFFANQHCVGYSFYNSFCEKIFCNSKKVASDYKDFFPMLPKEKIKFFPPFAPYEFKNARFLPEDKKENAVILAAPFDLRKGLKKIPALLAAAAKSIETLYIFGMPRCSENNFNDFFKSLSVSKIVYCPKISYADLIALYKKSKVLLFPSSEEGLGIPIIEAQICGCRVLTTDAPPMKDLILEGCAVLKNEKGDKKILSKMLNEKFDFAQLSLQARKKFSYEKIDKTIFGE